MSDLLHSSENITDTLKCVDELEAAHGP